MVFLQFPAVRFRAEPPVQKGGNRLIRFRQVLQNLVPQFSGNLFS